MTDSNVYSLSHLIFPYDFSCHSSLPYSFYCPSLLVYCIIFFSFYRLQISLSSSTLSLFDHHINKFNSRKKCSSMKLYITNATRIEIQVLYSPFLYTSPWSHSSKAKSTFVKFLFSLHLEFKVQFLDLF